MNERHPIADVRRWLELREAEGLTFKQLAQRSGIPAHVFIYRNAHDQAAHSQSGPPATGFVEVVASDSKSCALGLAEPSGIELGFPGGLTATLSRDFDSTALSRLLDLLRC